jgi:hypothetical protein
MAENAVNIMNAGGASVFSADDMDINSNYIMVPRTAMYFPGGVGINAGCTLDIAAGAVVEVG